VGKEDGTRKIKKEDKKGINSNGPYILSIISTDVKGRFNAQGQQQPPDIDRRN
jgi:hypothetical protein